MSVTSSGTTTEFETYEFDVFTNQIVVAGYVTGDESISISEVSVLQIKTYCFMTGVFILNRINGARYKTGSFSCSRKGGR